MRKFLLTIGVLFALATTAALAQVDDGPALPDGLTFQQIVQGLANGSLTLYEVRQRGLAVFSTPFNTYDGHGDGPFDADDAASDPLSFGHRPTLQGNGQFLRVNGLDTQSCNECHTIVSNASRPPRLGFGGVGAVTQNAIIMPSVIDVADAYRDGVAEFNGRFANPPFLFGGGGVELVGKEMTADLQQYLATARAASAGTVTQLVTHGVNFGSITSLGGGNVQLNVQGIGFEDNSGHAPEEVLVVRPFGRKGENFTMRDFDRGAMQFHFGMQPIEVVGPNFDADGDGVKDEVTIGEMTALHIFDVTNPRPFMENLTGGAQSGFNRFKQIGCSDCHMPQIKTNSRYLPLAHPEVPEDPWANVYTEIDLVAVGFEPAPGGGVYVPMFADLKRHYMGPGLEESFARGEIPNGDFTTARLWGIADTAPYLHDGRATTLYQAIMAHGGEAQYARDNFLGLPNSQQKNVLAFLKKLRTPINPNMELVTGP